MPAAGSWLVACARRFGFAALVTLMLTGNGVEVRAACVTECSEYTFNDLAKLRMCRPVSDYSWDERCPEPWTLTLLKPDGSRFKNLREIEQISPQPTKSAPWIFASRPENKNLENPASSANQTYVVYDLESGTYAYEGNDFGKAEFEWERQNEMPHPNCADPGVRFPVLVGPYSVDDSAVFPASLQTRLGRTLGVAMVWGYILFILVAAWWRPIVIVAASSLILWRVVVPILSFLRRPGSAPEGR